MNLGTKNPSCHTVCSLDSQQNLACFSKNICTAMVEAIKHTYILEEYHGYGGPDQGVLDMKGVKVMLNVIVKILVMMTDHHVITVIMLSTPWETI